MLNIEFIQMILKFFLKQQVKTIVWKVKINTYNDLFLTEMQSLSAQVGWHFDPEMIMFLLYI